MHIKKRVIFRADGDASIGYGHFIRTLGLAGLINGDYNCVYAIRTPTDYQVTEILKVCNSVITLDKTTDHFEEFLCYLVKGDIVVLDNYFFDSNYQNKIREIGCRVIYIDDYNDKHYVCDALINNIPGFARSSFRKEEYTKLYLGTDFALLRQEFFNPKLRTVKKIKRNVFLSFGGSDIFNISEKVIEFLYKIDTDFQVNALIGDAYKYPERLTRFENVKTHKNISAGEVAQLIAQANICIVPASSLLNEAASVGSKILLGYFAKNQTTPYDYFVNNKMAIGVGDFRKMDLKLFERKFRQTICADFLVENQNIKYHYQQEDNLKNIFHDVSNR